MSALSKAIRKYLLDFSDLTDEIEGRIRPDELTQNETLPAIRYEVTSTDSKKNLSGAEELTETLLELECYGLTRESADTVAELVIDKLHGYEGTTDGITVSDCFLDNDFDDTDQPAPGEEKSRHIRNLTFRINHSRTPPTLT